MPQNPWLRPRPLTIAHRGHSIEYPENTTTAYKKAIDLGIEMIECDVNITRDGVLVMMHDPTLDRTTNGTGRVNAATWEELQQLDAGRKFNSRFKNTPIPLIRDTLNLFKEAGIYSCFEVKGGNVETSKLIAAALVDMFVEMNVLEKTLMSSYYHEAMLLAKTRVPELMLAPERLPDDAPPNNAETIRQARALESNIMQYQYTVLTPNVVEALHANDIALWAWTTNSESTLRYSIEVGADAVMGDDVVTMLAVLNQMRPIGTAQVTLAKDYHMDYGYVSRDNMRGQRYTIRKGQYIAGHAIGIIHLEVWYPLIPGNVVNASTYKYPVRMKQLQGGTQDKIHRGDPSVLEAIIAAGRELQHEGVRAIAGACGYLGNYQQEVAAALDVPVYLSSLVQVPMIHTGLKPGQRIGILCADGPALKPSILAACGVPANIPITVMGLEEKPEFSKITYSHGEFDVDRIEAEVVASAQQLVEQHPDTGAILLECSDMPPFAWAVQRAVRLPVFDFITMINWIHSAVVQRPYEGIF